MFNSKFKMMKKILFAAGIMLLLFSCAYEKKEADMKTPNILFIAIDDLNDWGVGALSGRAGVHTPNIDRLAGESVLFTNAHCSAPACNPSRTSIITGISPTKSGVYSNFHD